MNFRERWDNYRQLTLIPVLRRMFGRRRGGNTAMLICTFYLVGAMLGVICLSHHVNLKENERLSADYELYMTSAAAEAEANASTVAAQAFRHILASRVELTAVFFFLLTAWAILSAFTLTRVFHATVEQDKYVYGLYVTFGSDTRQVRRQIHTEFFLAALTALLLALPTAFLLTRAVYLQNGQSFRAGVAPYLQILLGLFAVSYLGAGYLSHRITSSSCIDLMTALDTSDYTSSPRTSRRFNKRLYNGPLRYARLAILRMRGYYIPLVLTVAVVAAVFFGTMNLALEGQREAAQHIHEYTVEFSRGINADAVQQGYIDHLLEVDDVESVRATAHGEAEELGTHLLVHREDFRSEEGHEAIDLGAYYATDSLRILCADGDTRAELGGQNILPDPWEEMLTLSQKAFNYTMIPNTGEAVYLYPAGREASLTVAVGDTVYLALPRGGNGRQLTDKAADDMYEHLPLRITEVIAVPDVYFSTATEATRIGPRIHEEYLLLNPEDYADVTAGATVESLTLDELYAEDLPFGNLKAPAVLLLPEDYEGEDITVLQMLTPVDRVTSPYSVTDPLDSRIQTILQSDVFYQNRTAFATYFYPGTLGDLNNDADAVERMHRIQDGSLIRYELTELTVTASIECAGLTAPCLLLPNDGLLSSYDGDLCVLQLTPEETFWSTADELFVFGTPEALTLPSYLGRTLYSHTVIEPGFFEEMRAQGLYTTYPTEDAYSLSAFSVEGMFDLGASCWFVCRLSPDCNLGIDRYPAYTAPGDDFFFRGEPSEDSAMSLAATASYLSLRERHLAPAAKSAAVAEGEFSATVGLTVSLADPINRAVLTPDTALPTLAPGEAVLVLRPDSPLLLQAGEKVRLAVREDFALDPNDPKVASLTGNALLSHLLTEGYEYRYVSLNVREVIVADLPQDILYLSEVDWLRIRRTESTYRMLDIYLFGDTDLISLIRSSGRIRALMGNWQDPENVVTLRSHDRLWKALTTGACNYPALLRILGVMLILLLPLLWCSPQTMHFRKRAEEFTVMSAVGKTGGQLRRMIASECLLITAAAGLFVALLCPLTVLAVRAAIYMMELPFESAAFDVKAYLFMILFVMLCSALSFLTAAPHITDKNAKDPKNTKGDDET